MKQASFIHELNSERCTIANEPGIEDIYISKDNNQGITKALDWVFINCGFQNLSIQDTHFNSLSITNCTFKDLTISLSSSESIEIIILRNATIETLTIITSSSESIVNILKIEGKETKIDRIEFNGTFNEITIRDGKFERGGEITGNAIAELHLTNIDHQDLFYLKNKFRMISLVSLTRVNLIIAGADLNYLGVTSHINGTIKLFDSKIKNARFRGCQQTSILNRNVSGEINIDNGDYSTISFEKTGENINVFTNALKEGNLRIQTLRIIDFRLYKGAMNFDHADFIDVLIENFENDGVSSPFLGQV